MTFTLTQQQQDFLDAAAPADRGILCEAGAGAGKTTTAKKAAAQHPRKRILYTAFNKAIVKSAETSMPPNVRCRTSYGIAWDGFGVKWKRTLDIKGQKLADVARILRINDPLRLSGEHAPLTTGKVARLALKTVEQFCSSADAELDTKHVPLLPGTEDVRGELVSAILPVAKRAYADMLNPEAGQIGTKPGFYFKQWALGRPQIPADILIVDEVQDTDPVLAAVLRDQQIPMWLIGDDAQRIYEWRGCVSVMGDFPAYHQLRLTTSFRFGQEVADEANKWLEMLGTDMRITGAGPTSTVGMIARPDAILTRSNAAAVSEAITAAAEGRKVHIKGASDEVKRLAEGAAQLQQGRPAWHEELQAFNSWDQVVQYVEDGLASTELENTVRLLDTHGVDVVVAALSNTVAESWADLVVTTTHKVKGLEWDNVRIGSDWMPPRKPGEPIPAATKMLAYVAVTRAKKGLDVGGLWWTDSALGAHREEVEHRERLRIAIAAANESPLEEGDAVTPESLILAQLDGDLDDMPVDVVNELCNAALAGPAEPTPDFQGSARPAETPAVVVDLPTEPLARAVEMLRRHEDAAVSREIEGRPFGSADRAAFVRELLSAYLGHDVREELAKAV